MASQWKYKQGDSVFGPVTSRQLKELAVAGSLLPDDLVWKEGLANWVSARRVKGLFQTNSTNAAAALSGINLGAKVEKLNLGPKPETAEPTAFGQVGKARKEIVGERKHQARQNPNENKTPAPPTASSLRLIAAREQSDVPTCG